MKKAAPLSDLDRKVLRRLRRLSSGEIQGYLALAESGRVPLAASVQAKLRAHLAELDAQPKIRHLI
jgi:hypothetical protein